MVSSKSTDKLNVIKEIISSLRETLDDDQLGRLKEINLGWEAVSTDFQDTMPCPTLNIKLYAQEELDAMKKPEESKKTSTVLLEKE